MSNAAGKGDARRPNQVTSQQLNDNWNRTFGNKQQPISSEKVKCGKDCNTCECKQSKGDDHVIR